MEEIKMIDLGFSNMAKLRVRNGTPELILMSPAVLEENCYVPASSYIVWGIPAIESLTKALNEYLARQPKEK